MNEVKKRSERSDKKLRIYPYLKSDTFNRLEIIRQAVNVMQPVSIHDLAEDILDIALNMPEFVTWLQNKYKVPADHPLRIVPVKSNGMVTLHRLFEAHEKNN